MVTPERLREILSYDAETGDLIWKHREPKTRGDNIFNAKYAGKIAFSYIGTEGYRYGCINGHGRLAAHRVIWAIVHNVWPEFIDHINGNRSDNRLINLREVTKSQNAQNQKCRSDNTSGMMGVNWSAQHGRWRVRVQVNGRRVHVGMFDTVEKAKEAKIKAEKTHGYGPNHNRVSP
jgi:hypothetical protein